MNTIASLKSISNPTLYYALDPGEPGLATPAKASESIGRVAMHEGGNIRRFEAEAQRKGGVVVYSNIFLNLQQRGSFLAATSGRSEAVIVYPGKKKDKKDIAPDDNTDLKKTENKIPDESKIEQNKDEKNVKDKPSDLFSAKQEPLEKIKDKLDELKNEEKELKSELKNSRDPDPYKENKVKKLEAEINYLEQKKNIEDQKKLFESFIDGKNFAFKLIGLNYKNNTESNLLGMLVDTMA